MSLEMNGVTIDVVRSEVSLTKDNSQILLHPGELTKMAELLGTSARMKNFKALKSRIGEDPLWVRFNQDDTLTLVATNRGELPLKWEEIDGLVDVLNEGVNQFKAFGYKAAEGRSDVQWTPFDAIDP